MDVIEGRWPTANEHPLVVQLRDIKASPLKEGNVHVDYGGVEIALKYK